MPEAMGFEGWFVLVIASDRGWGIEYIGDIVEHVFILLCYSAIDNMLYNICGDDMFVML